MRKQRKNTYQYFLAKNNIIFAKNGDPTEMNTQTFLARIFIVECYVIFSEEHCYVFPR